MRDQTVIRDQEEDSGPDGCATVFFIGVLLVVGAGLCLTGIGHDYGTIGWEHTVTIESPEHVTMESVNTWNDGKTAFKEGTSHWYLLKGGWKNEEGDMANPALVKIIEKAFSRQEVQQLKEKLAAPDNAAAEAD